MNHRFIFSKKKILDRIPFSILDYTKLPLTYSSGKIAMLGDKIYFALLRNIDLLSLEVISFNIYELFDLYFPVPDLRLFDYVNGNAPASRYLELMYKDDLKNYGYNETYYKFIE